MDWIMYGSREAATFSCRPTRVLVFVLLARHVPYSKDGLRTAPAFKKLNQKSGQERFKGTFFC